MKKQILILFGIFLLFSGVAFAQGEGDGGGENQGEPLTLTACSISEGQIGVSIAPQIQLTFSKNVVNMQVAASNKECFSIKDEQGKSVAIEVRMGDDQVDPTIKRIITIVPLAPLEQGTKYTMHISNGLTAKSGSKMQSAKSISFTTKEAVPAAVSNAVTETQIPAKQSKPAQQSQPAKEAAEEPQAPMKPAEDEPQKESAVKMPPIQEPPQIDEGEKINTTPKEESKKQELSKEQGVAPWVWIFVVILAVMIVCITVVYVRKRAKNGK